MIMFFDALYRLSSFDGWLCILWKKIESFAVKNYNGGYVWEGEMEDVMTVVELRCGGGIVMEWMEEKIMMEMQNEKSIRYASHESISVVLMERAQQQQYNE